MDTRNQHRSRLAVLLPLIAALGGTLLPWSAVPARAVNGITSGGSIAFIKDHNVWLTSPDGVTQRQLTTDGTATTPYRDPTQSDAGTVIVAVQDRKEQQGGFVRSYLYEMDRSGTLLRAPFAPAQFTTVLGGSCTIPVLTAPDGILAAVSPDGTRIAVDAMARFFYFDCGGTFESEVRVVDLAGTLVNDTIQPPGTAAPLALQMPSWISNTRLLLYHDLENGVFYYDLGAATATLWRASRDFSDNAYAYPSFRSGKLATTGGDSSGQPVLRLWTTSGPPTQPTARCDIPNPDPLRYDYLTFEFAVPRLAPDGAAVVWQEIDTTGSTPVDGLYISPAGAIGTGDCSSIGRQAFIAGGSDPYWGPAGMTAPASTLSVGDVSVSEGDGGTRAATFTITRTGATTGPATVRYATANGTATAGSDYTALPLTTLDFAAGDASRTISVTVMGDTTVEPNETFLLQLSGPTGAAIADGSGLGTIVNDDSAPTGGAAYLSVSDVSVTEGDSGTSPARFSVTRRGDTTSAVSVRAASASGSAVAGSDFTALAPTTLSFAAGETAKTVEVAVTGDTLFEPTETFSLQLSSPVGATISDPTGLATVVNDDAASYLSVADVSVAEGASGAGAVASFTVRRRGSATGPASVRVGTAGGTATAAVDFTALAASTVTFAPGETVKSVAVTVTGDTVFEPDEAFSLIMSLPAGAVIEDGVGVATIVNDDAPVFLSVTDVTLTEGGAGATDATFLVRRSGATTGAVSVKVATSNGTAAAGSDYTALGLTTVAFAAGEIARSVTVAVAGDSTIEPNETFTLRLSSPVGATIADASGTATIVDDDGTLTPGPATFLSVKDVTVAEGDTGTRAAAFTVTRTGDTTGVSWVTYATSNGTALSGSDFSGVPATRVSFAAGVTRMTVSVPLLGDATLEPDETFSLRLSSPSGAVISDTAGTATIVNDDAPVSLSIGDLSVREPGTAAATATFVVTRSGATAGPVSVRYMTVNGTAAAATDYTALAPATLSFAAGQTSRTVSVAIAGDAAYEANETFSLALSAAVGATIADTAAVATILNDDAPVYLSVTDTSRVEGDTASAPAGFVVVRTGNAAVPVSLRIATAAGSATAGTDFASIPPTVVTFAAGETAKPVSVAVSGDTAVEPNESFSLQLSAPVGAVLSDSAGVATIVNDD